MDIMMKIEGPRLQSLKRAFLAEEDGLTLKEFTSAILTNLPREYVSRISEIDMKKLIEHLIQLFNEIDRNSNGKLDWDEFSNYSIEKANETSTINSAPLKFHTNATFQDNVSRSRRVDIIGYIQGYNMCYAVENERAIVNFFKSEGSPFWFDKFDVREFLKAWMQKQASKHDGMKALPQVQPSILFVNVLPDAGVHYLVVHTSNLHVFCFKLKLKATELLSEHVSTLKVDTMKTLIFHDKAFSKVYLCGVSSKFEMLNFPSLRSEFLKVADTTFNMAITDGIICKLKPKETKEKDRLILCSFAGNLAVFARDRDGFLSVFLRKFARQPTGFKQMILIQLGKYNHLATIGYSQKAFVWNISQCELHTTLHGHETTIIGIDSITHQGVNIIITLALEGMFKTWDCMVGTGMNAICLATFTFSPLSVNGKASLFPHSFVYANNSIWTASNVVSHMEVNGSDISLAKPGEFAKEIHYITQKSHIVFLTNENRVIIVEGCTGKVVTIFDCRVKHDTMVDICAFGMGSMGKKVFGADIKGNVFVKNIENGFVMKKVQIHCSLVIKILCQKIDDLVFVVTSCGQIYCLDDILETDLIVIRSLKNVAFQSDKVHSANDLSGATIVPRYNFIIVLFEGRFIMIYNSEYLRLINIFSYSNERFKITQISAWPSKDLICVLRTDGAKNTLFSVLSYDILALGLSIVIEIRPHGDEVLSMFNVCGNMVVIGWESGLVSCYELNFGNVEDACRSELYRSETYDPRRRLFITNSFENKRSSIYIKPQSADQLTFSTLFHTSLFSGAISAIEVIPEEQYILVADWRKGCFRVVQIPHDESHVRTLVNASIERDLTSTRKSKSFKWRLNFSERLMSIQKKLREEADILFLDLNVRGLLDSCCRENTLAIVPADKNIQYMESSSLQVSESYQRMRFSLLSVREKCLFHVKSTAAFKVTPRALEDRLKAELPNFADERHRSITLRNRSGNTIERFSKENFPGDMNSRAPVSQFLREELNLGKFDSLKEKETAALRNRLSFRKRTPFNFKFLKRILTPSAKTFPETCLNDGLEVAAVTDMFQSEEYVRKVTEIQSISGISSKNYAASLKN